jgi:hypothetical protein
MNVGRGPSKNGATPSHAQRTKALPVLKTKYRYYTDNFFACKFNLQINPQLTLNSQVRKASCDGANLL